MEQFLAYGLCKGAIFAISGAGFYLIYTTTRVFHIAHAATCAFATYVAYVCFVQLHLPLLVTFILAGLATGLLGFGVDVSVYKPLQRKRGSALVLLISSLGVNVILTNVLLLSFGSKPVVFHSGAEPTKQILQVILTQTQILQLFGFVLVAIVYLVAMKVGPFGRLCTALADNSTLASTLGVNVLKSRAYIFAIGSAMAAVGAVLMALDVGTEPHAGIPLMFSSVAACIIGGLDRHEGPIVGGLILGLVQGLVSWAFKSEWEFAATFILVITVLLIRGQGVLVVGRRPEEA